MANKKNGGRVPAVLDRRCTIVPVGCGKCMECRKQKAREWQVRLHEEIRDSEKGIFVTLTFSDESIIELGTGEPLNGYDLDNEIARKGVRRFLERWRKKYGKSVRHWLVTELGQNETERIHLHGLIWTDKGNEMIEHHWKYGYCHFGSYVNGETVNYIVKYINKADEKHKEYKSRIFTSSGIGAGYLDRWDSSRNKYKGKKTNEEYVTRSGKRLALPIYYRNKLYSDEEKELLWIQKLDEEVRWVNGTKIDISKNEDVYFKRLELEREKNKRLGYGDNEVNWDLRNYENERRNLKKLELLKKKYDSDGNLKRTN